MRETPTAPPVKASSGALLGIGVIGGGMIAQVAHLPFYLADPRVEVVGVAEPRPSLKAHLSEVVGVARVVDHHSELLDDRRVDAVVLCAPRPATGPLSKIVIEAGKDLLAEKPMAHSVSQAETLVRLAEERHVTYALGFMKLYDPGVEVAKRVVDEALASGRFGKLISARFFNHAKRYAADPPAHQRPLESRAVRFETWPLAPEWLDPGLEQRFAWFLNTASHTVNLMTYFFGHDGLELLHADSPSDDALFSSFGLEEARLHLEVCRTEAGRWLEGAEFLFESGRIVLDLPSPMAAGVVATVTIDSRETGRTDALPQYAEGGGWCFARQATGFVDALTGVTGVRATGLHGLRDMVLIEQIWRRI